MDERRYPGETWGGGAGDSILRSHSVVCGSLIEIVDGVDVVADSWGAVLCLRA